MFTRGNRKEMEKFIPELQNYIDKKFDEFKVNISINNELLTEFKNEIKQEIDLVGEKFEQKLLSISKENDAVKEEVINLKKENERLSSDLEELCQYGRRLCLRIDNVAVLERESSEEVLKSVKSLIEKSGEVIPDSTLDRAHRIGPVYTNKEKGKCQSIIVRFSTFRHRTLFYRARRKIKTGEKIRLDLIPVTLRGS